MCGIVGYVGNKDVINVLIDGLRHLEYRGYDSAGVAVFSHNQIEVIKTKGRLDDLQEKINREGKPEGTCGIGHTRWATHGEPSDINSHPHGNKVVSIVHNGIIENYMSIRERLEEKGYVFESQTDTETIAKLLDYYYHGDPLDAIRSVLAIIHGSYALGIIFKDFPDRIYATRKDSPLIVGVGENENFIASDVPAILKYTRDYYLLEQDEIVELKANSVLVTDINGDKIEKELQTATWDIEAAEKGGFPHFMIKEIHEQPTAITATISPWIKDGLPFFDLPNLSDHSFSTFKNIHIVACGTAMHAGMIGKYLIEKMAHIPVNVDIASEYRYRDPIVGKDDLVIIISQSGETADTLEALRLSKRKGAHTLAIVNVLGSSIAREADDVIYTRAGPEISVASTKAYSVQISIMYLISVKLALLSGKITEDYAKSFCETLQSIPAHIEEMLKHENQYQFFASQFQNAHSLFYIGRGLDYALSMEGSLKLKEISYIHSEAYAAGELKHGTISLITKDVPVIAVATQSSLFEKSISNIKEVKARGAKVFLICKGCENVSNDVADFTLSVPSLDDIFMPLMTVVPLQLLAYYSAVLRGCDVDKPRNLAKSVTVE